MSLVNRVTFETGDFSQCALTTGSPAIITNPVYEGKYAATIARSGTITNFEIRQNVATYYNLGVVWYLFYFLARAYPSSGDSAIVNFQDTASGFKAGVHLTSSGFPVYYDINATIIWNSVTKLNLNTWYAIGAKIGTGTGTIFEIQINGVTDYSTSTAVNVGNNNNGSLKFGGGVAYTDNFCFDYIAIDNAGYPAFSPGNPPLFAVSPALDAGPHPALLSPGQTTYFLPPTAKFVTIQPRVAVLAVETRPDLALLTQGEAQRVRGIVPVPVIKPPRAVLSAETIPAAFPPPGEVRSTRGVLPVATVKPNLPVLVEQTSPALALLQPGFIFQGAIKSPPPVPRRVIYVAEDAPFQPFPPAGLAYASHASAQLVIKPPLPVLSAETAPQPFPPVGETKAISGVIPVPFVKPPLPVVAVASEPVAFPPAGSTQTFFIVAQPVPPAAMPVVASTQAPEPPLLAPGSTQVFYARPLVNVKPPLPVVSREDAPVQPFPPAGTTQAFVAPIVRNIKPPLPVLAREDAPLQPFPPGGETRSFVGTAKPPTIKPPPPVLSREDAPVQPFPPPGSTQSFVGVVRVPTVKPPLPVIAREDTPLQPFPPPGWTQSFVGIFPVPQVRPQRSVITPSVEPVPFPDGGSTQSFRGVTPPPAASATVVITAPTTTYPVQPTIKVQVFDPFGNPAAGQVTLAVDGGAPTSATLDSTGTGSFPLTGLAPGDHTLSANYAAQFGVPAGSATGSVAVGGVVTAIKISSIGSMVRVGVSGSFQGSDGYNNTDAPASPVAFVGQAGPVTVLVYTSLGLQGLQCAASCLSRALADYQAVQEYFGTTAQLGPVTLVVAPLSSANNGGGGGRHDTNNKTIIYADAAFQDSRITSANFVAELVEVGQINQGLGWIWNWGNGEALSRVLAEAIYPGLLNKAASAGAWLDSYRPDYVTRNINFDGDALGNGCGVLFLWWLVSLGFTLEQIARAGASTLALTYQKLTGKTTAFADFSAAVDMRWPPGQPSGVSNDNAWQNPQAVPPLLGPPLPLLIPSPMPTGSVTLTVGSGNPISQWLQQAPVDSEAVFAIPLPTGPVTLTASYSGNGVFTATSVSGMLTPAGYRYAVLDIAGRKDLTPTEQQFIGPFSITNSSSGDAVTTVDLGAGDNNIAIPAGGPYVAAVIIPPPSNKVSFLLKGASGDTGIPLHPSNPTVLGLAGVSQASIAFRASSADRFTPGNASVTVTKPAGTQPTDILICFLNSTTTGTGGQTFTAPFGWTAIAPGSFRNENPLDADSQSVSLYGFWALGSVANLTFTQSTPGSSNSGWNCLAFSNVDNTTPIDAVGTASGAYGAVGGTGPTAATANAVTTITNKALELIAGCDGASTNNITQASFNAVNGTSNIPAPTNVVLYAKNPTASAGSTGTFSVSDDESDFGGSDSCNLLLQPFALRAATVGQASLILSPTVAVPGVVIQWI